MDSKDLEARVKTLEDIEEIRKLKATYCYLCDVGTTEASVRRELISHFTKEASVDFGMGPESRFQGWDGLEVFFGTIVPMGVTFSMHMVHNPIIDVNGDKATGRWYYEAPTIDTTTGKAQWMAGTYEEEYVREDGQWKFSSISTKWKYITPYDEGWASNRGILLTERGI